MGSALDIDGSTARRQRQFEKIQADVEQKAREAALAKDPVPQLPDLTDQAVQDVRKRERIRSLSMQGLSSTFLTGARGLTGKPVTATPSLLGS